MNEARRLADEYVKDRDRQRTWPEFNKESITTERYVKAFVFPTEGPARVTMVKSDEKWIRNFTFRLCERRYKDVAEAKKSFPKGGGMELFYLTPTQKSGFGRGYRWKSSVGSGIDEFLLGPAVLVAANTSTGKIRDFTVREEHRAISFDRQNYKSEKMFGLSSGEVLFIIKGHLDGIESTDCITVVSENWQLLYVTVEHGQLSFSMTIPKSCILDGEVELVRSNGEPV